MRESINSENLTEQKTFLFPSLTERIKSSVIDFLLILFTMSIVAMLFDEFENVPDWTRALLFIGLFFIYEPLAQTFGCTLGNYIMGIRVRSSASPDNRINIIQAYIRFAAKSLLGSVSFFTINSNSQRRAIHDTVSGSVMIYA